MFSLSPNPQVMGKSFPPLCLSLGPVLLLLVPPQPPRNLALLLVLVCCRATPVFLVLTSSSSSSQMESIFSGGMGVDIVVGGRNFPP